MWHNDKADSVFIDTELKNYSDEKVEIEFPNEVSDEKTRQVLIKINGVWHIIGFGNLI